MVYHVSSLRCIFMHHCWSDVFIPLEQRVCLLHETNSLNYILLASFIKHRQSQPLSKVKMAL